MSDELKIRFVFIGGDGKWVIFLQISPQKLSLITPMYVTCQTEQKSDFGGEGGGEGHDIWVIYLQIKNKSSL